MKKICFVMMSLFLPFCSFISCKTNDDGEFYFLLDEIEIEKNPILKIPYNVKYNNIFMGGGGV